jgi:NAD/NADP transhydrogenase alpha subunit
MIIAIPKENNSNETRVSCSPGSIKLLIKSGFKVNIEKDDLRKQAQTLYQTLKNFLVNQISSLK